MNESTHSSHSDSHVYNLTGSIASGKSDSIFASPERLSHLFYQHFLSAEERLLRLLGDDSSKFPDKLPSAKHDLVKNTDKTASVSPSNWRPARVIDEDDYNDDTESTPVIPSFASTENELNIPFLSGFTSKDPNLFDALTGENQNLDLIDKLLGDSVKRSCFIHFHTFEDDAEALRLANATQSDPGSKLSSRESGKSPVADLKRNSKAQSKKDSSFIHLNLGASSLTLKNLLLRMDAKRSFIEVDNQEICKLVCEVKKNRSKWANEDKIGQQELYDAAEYVLNYLKAQSDLSAPFMQRVNKRDAPDYYSIIKQPMDLGTMFKKLRSFHYKSKKEFVYDLFLIWSNCLKYNQTPDYFLRAKAECLRKRCETLVQYIPDVTVRDRVDVEAEERRLKNAKIDFNGNEDSDDEPIMTSRTRQNQSLQSNNGTNLLLKNSGIELPRASALLNTSEVTTATVQSHNSGPGENETSTVDTKVKLVGKELEKITNKLANTGNESLHSGAESPDKVPKVKLTLQEIEHELWREKTKQARMDAVSRRNRLFIENRINPDEPALLVTEALVNRCYEIRDAMLSELDESNSSANGNGNAFKTNQSILPDYYEVVSSIPDLSSRLTWEIDSEGHVIDPCEDCLRLIPEGHFTSPVSAFSRKIEWNMRQIQMTRKICSKIAMVKQMQVQSQTYHNLYNKYNPKPFVEIDIGKHVVSDDGPVMASSVCWAALQRSLGKIFFHAGFEEYQPSALDTITDIAGQYLQNLAKTLKTYLEAPKIPRKFFDISNEKGISTSPSPTTATANQWLPRFCPNEAILHALHQNGMSISSLESYVNEEIDRLGNKLRVMHERMKSHYADLLRPSIDSSHGPDGVGAFSDGSEQFVGGDFAEDIGVDFFGFRELGLDKEFGLSSLSVPLHLLQNRLFQGYQNQNASTVTATGLILKPAPPYEPLKLENIKQQIGLVQDFFLEKLKLSPHSDRLIEDDELPAKQRFPKPRLPPSGKITSPRKRPIREQQMLAKKRRKLEEEAAAAAAAAAATTPSALGSNSATQECATNPGAESSEGSTGNGVAAASTGKLVSKLKLDFPGPPKKLPSVTFVLSKSSKKGK